MTKNVWYLLRRTLLTLLLTTLLMAGSVPLTAAPQAQTTGLFAPAEGHGIPTISDPTVTRARFITVDLERLGGLAGPPHNGSGVGERVLLNLFDDAIYTAILDRVEATDQGYIWIGHLADVEYSLVTLVVHEAGLLIGKVATPSLLYEVRYDGATQMVVELDPAAFPPEQAPIPAAVAPDPAPPPGVAADDDGELIDVMVVYSTDTKNALGGTAATEAHIDLAIAETNQGYANSGITQRVALVYAAEVTDAADDFDVDLGRLQDPSDGYMDYVHTWRDTYHADDTALLINDTQYCGLAYLMSTVDVGFESWAFALVYHGCATGYYSLAHEWGHNMGARHDWYVDDAKGSPYSYDKGFVNVTDQWRTVMAYNSLCSAQSTNCTRLPYWSNPNVSYNGDPMGIVYNGPTNCVAGSTSPDPSTCAADNRMTLDTTAPTVDQFRNSESVWQGSDGNWNDAGNWSLGYVPRAIDDVYIPASASSFPTVNGTYTARKVTIESGATLNQSSGTLTVYGDWVNQGTYNATGGSVVFAGTLDQAITSGGSAFPNLQIGDGTSTQAVSLTDDLDVDGDLTIQAGTTLAGGAHTLTVAGDWTDYGTSFTPDTSTVVFDGGTQSIYKTGDLTFYNLTLANSGAATLSGDVTVNNHLTVNAGAALDLGAHTATVEGTLTNNGTLSQTLNVASSSTAQFLRITDGSGATTKYYGVDITPASTGLGSTTVGLMGNQAQCTTDGGDALLTRCYKIEPGSAQNATVRFWYTEAERNGQDASALQLWHYDGPPGQWSLEGDTYQRSETGTSCTSGGGTACWFQAANVDTYSPFGVGSGAEPNALVAHGLRGVSGSRALLLGLGCVSLIVAGFVRRRRRTR